MQAQPAQGAAVAADTGGAGRASVERYRPYHQGQGERQVQPTGDVHVHLQATKTTECISRALRRKADPKNKHFGHCPRASEEAARHFSNSRNVKNKQRKWLLA